MSLRSPFVSTLLVSLCVCARAAADDAVPTAEPVVDVEAHSQRKITATNALDATASGTTISLDNRASTPRILSDVLREAPGAVVISTGGIGAFASMSLRGASDNETTVLLGEIPLTTPDEGAFDLSLFPVELFQEVNTFRGGAPVWLGSGAIGGVLQLVPRRGQRNGMNISAGAGSFGTYQLNGGTQTSLKSGLVTNSQLVVRSTNGNYSYVNDNNTRFDSSDDRTLRLRNADFLEMSGLQDLSVPLWGGKLHAIAMGVSRGGGLAGPAARPTPKIRREAARALGAVDYTLEGGEGTAHRRKLQLLASTSYSADRFTDLFGQLGTSSRTQRDNDGYRTFVRGAGSLGLTRWLEANVVGSYAYNRYSPHDELATFKPEKSHRHTAAAAGELVASGSVHGVRMELRPSARVEWNDTVLNTPRASIKANTFPHERSLVVPTFRVGGVVEPIRGVALSASAATGTRAPTILELFGDGGVLLPNPTLKPVKSTTVDGGLTLRGRYRLLHGTIEQRAFWLERKNAIVLSRNNQFQAGYDNFPAVHALGAETHAVGGIAEYARVNGTFTYLKSEDQLGNRMPITPRYTTYVRPEFRIPIERAFFSSAQLSSELWHRSYMFFSQANLGYNPACTKLAFSAAFAMFDERVRFTARMDDSLNARCFDSLGYPLPGRSLFFSLSYREVDHEES